jgi:glycosyltransferase involved in cell wall biosynthesis
MEIIVLHEYGDKRHFIALEELKKDGKIDNISYFEFNIFKQFAKSIIYRDIDRFKRCIYKIKNIAKLSINKNQIIIIGAAPYDYRIFLLYILKKRNKIFYFTSWPYWDYTFYPKRIYFKYQKSLWEKFLNNIEVISITQKAYETLIKYNVKFHHIPHSVNRDIYLKESEEIKKAELEYINVLFVGRLEYYKGQELIIEIIKKKIWANVKFVIVGDGSYKEELIDLKNKDFNVDYKGYIKNEIEKAKIYAEADILILPSIKVKNWEELFGIVIIEAMSAGLPVIATDCVGPKEIISNGIDGFIIKQNNIDELIEKIDLLVRDSNLRSKMSNAAKEKSKFYDIDNIKKLWAEVLKL